MKIDRFDGGISRRLLPQYLAPNEAVDLVNVDTDKGALVPTKAWSSPVFDSMVAANYGINAMDRWFWFNQYTPSVEANNRLYYADNTGTLRSFDANGNNAAAFMLTPTTGPVLSDVVHVTPLPTITVQVSGVVADTSKAPNRPTQYVAIVRKTVGGAQFVSPPMLIDVLSETNYTATVVSPDALESLKRTVDEVTGSSRTVTFSAPFAEAGTTADIGRLVGGKFRKIGSITSTTSVTDSYTDASLIVPSPGSASFSGVAYNSNTEAGSMYRLRAAGNALYVAARNAGSWVEAATPVRIRPDGTFTGSSIVEVSDGGTTFSASASANAINFFIRANDFNVCVATATFSSNFFSTPISSGFSKIIAINGVLKFENFVLDPTRDNGYYIMHGLGQISASSSAAVDVAAVLDEEIRSLLHGEYQYVVTAYNPATGEESGPSQSLTVNVEYASGVQLQLPSGFHRVYRVGGNLTSFTLLGSSSSEEYFDSSISVNDTLFLDIEAANPPSNISSLTFSGGRMWAASGDRVYFSGIGKPWRWTALGFLAFNKPVRSVQAVANGVLVCLPDTTHLVTGTDESSFASLQISGSQGCVHDKTMAAADGLAIWLSNDGICASSGSDVRLLSRDKLDFLRLATPGNAVIWNDTYVLLDSAIGGQGLIMLEYGEGLLFKRVSTTYNKFIATYDDKLFIGNGASVRQLFAGTADSPLRYVSPKYAEGSVTTAKVYTEVRVYHKGDIMLEVYINDELVTSKLLTGTDNSLLKIPEQKKRGNYIQFIITGTGTVYELDYRVSQA